MLHLQHGCWLSWIPANTQPLQSDLHKAARRKDGEWGNPLALLLVLQATAAQGQRCSKQSAGETLCLILTESRLQPLARCLDSQLPVTTPAPRGCWRTSECNKVICSLYHSWKTAKDTPYFPNLVLAKHLLERYCCESHRIPLATTFQTNEDTEASFQKESPQAK